MDAMTSGEEKLEADPIPLQCWVVDPIMKKADYLPNEAFERRKKYELKD